MAEKKSYRDLVAEQMATSGAAPVEPVSSPEPNLAVQSVAAVEQPDQAIVGQARIEVPVEHVVEQPLTPSVQSKTFSEYLLEKGYEVEGIDQDDLYAQVVEQLGYVNTTRQEINSLKKQLEESTGRQTASQLADSLKSAAQQTPAESTVSGQTSPAAAIQRSLARLQAPDATLYQLVQRDEDSGTFVPKPGIGEHGFQAAKEINDYHREKNRRAEQLLADPLEMFGSDLQAMIRKEAQEISRAQMQEWQNTQKEEYSRQNQAYQQQATQQRIDAFYEAHKSKLFLLDATTGQPRTVLSSGEPALTASGQKFRQSYAMLQQRFPQSDVVSLMETAIELATPAQAVVPPIVKSAEEKKDAFLSGGRLHQTPAGLHGTPVASTEVQKAINGRRISFKQMVLQDPRNTDRLAGLGLTAG